MEIIKISVTLGDGKKKTFKYRVSDVAQFEVAYERVLKNFDFTRSDSYLDKRSKGVAFLKSSGYLDHYKSNIYQGFDFDQLIYRGFDFDQLNAEEYIDMILYLIKRFSSPDLVIERYKQHEYHFGGEGLFL